MAKVTSKLSCKIKASKFIKVLYPLWFIQAFLGMQKLYIPKWAFKVEFD